MTSDSDKHTMHVRIYMESISDPISDPVALLSFKKITLPLANIFLLRPHENIEVSFGVFIYTWSSFVKIIRCVQYMMCGAVTCT